MQRVGVRRISLSSRFTSGLGSNLRDTISFFYSRRLGDTLNFIFIDLTFYFNTKTLLCLEIYIVYILFVYIYDFKNFTRKKLSDSKIKPKR